ncbi:pseudouridine synthase [Oceanimonas sp. NS1]|nr:pseudouridine synthase [Oceanimonas sp. NS1]
MQGLESAIIYEDDALLVLNKPSGMAVHGGSGLSFGVIEGLRSLRPQARFLELVHRLDRDTSGILLVAKNAACCAACMSSCGKRPWTSTTWRWCAASGSRIRRWVKAPLKKNELASGERIVKVDREGKPSETRFRIVQKFDGATLVECSPVTGRTHQIRVHTLHAGHPIAGDDKYGDRQFDEKMKGEGWGGCSCTPAAFIFIIRAGKKP